jgi:hypothetical protein
LWYPDRYWFGLLRPLLNILLKTYLLPIFLSDPDRINSLSPLGETGKGVKLLPGKRERGYFFRFKMYLYYFD